MAGGSSGKVAGVFRVAKEAAHLALVGTVCWALFICVPAGRDLALNASRLVWNAAQLAGTLDREVKENDQDFRAAVHSARVVAQRSEGTAADLQGIAASVNSMAWKAAQPESRREKVVAGLKIGALVLSRFVPF